MSDSGDLTLAVREDVALAPLTTLELGGRARHFVEARDEATILAALAWARAHGAPLFVLGGGSNVVVADAGYDGLVLRVCTNGRSFVPAGGEVLVTAAAGEPWDALVAETVARGLAGLECLSGIPGSVGATPIQNVGAYGQEVAETIRSVRVVDRRDGSIVELPPAACAFGYRDSAFRRAPERHVVLDVTFALRPGGPPTLRYRELGDAIGGAPTLSTVRDTVIALRRRKSMVIDAADPNRRSVGSFFTNPIVAADVAQLLVERSVAGGLVRAPEDVPRWPAGAGFVKLSAGWLIERAGIAKGLRAGAVGVSTNHALALVHHGGGTTAELVALARRVRDAVAARFGVTLAPEPIFVGAAWSDGPATRSPAG
ncbi:MAG TPA: UDP-N-acetylmuramate dehydrogenase [Polyangia bacterium]|nr:UDP-N-acetylmuramate dehydrogenase [Polyangia bacterium]